jgi:2-polyprenyl-6-methoxyphenol hydroxylase-like FAD-dependent oxidoreductase
VERIDPHEYDLVVASDGVHSRVREQFAPQFEPRSTFLPNRYVWYGTHRVFKTLSLIFREFEGGCYVVHTYRFSPQILSLHAPIPTKDSCAERTTSLRCRLDPELCPEHQI